MANLLDPNMLAAGQQALGDQSWMDAGQQALGDQSWADVGANAAGGWLGAGQEALGGGPGTYNPGGSWGTAGFDAYANTGKGASEQINTVALAAMMSANGGGGLSISSPGSSTSNPFTGTSSTGGGGGGASGSVSPLQQKPNSGSSSTYPNSIYGGGAQSGSSALGILGLLSNYLNKNQVPSVGAPDLGLNIPSVSSSPNILSNASAPSNSFSGQQSNNQPTPLQSSSSGGLSNTSVPNMATSGSNSASGSLFNGNFGQQASNAGVNSLSFAGSAPTPAQAMQQVASEGNNYPGNYPNSAVYSGAPSGMPSGGFTGSMGADNGVAGIPASAAANFPAVAAQGASSGSAPSALPMSPPGTAKDQATAQSAPSSTLVIKDPTDPNNTLSANISTADQAPSGPAVIKDPTDPNNKLTVLDKFKAAASQLDPGLSDVASTVSSNFQQGMNKQLTMAGGALVGKDQAELNAVQKMLDQDQAKVDAASANHPYLAKAADIAGQVAPWAALQAGTRGLFGAGLAGSVGSGIVANTLAGYSQYAPDQQTRYMNAGIGAAIGAASTLLGPILSQVGVPIASGAAVAYTGFKHGEGILDTLEKTTVGAVTGFLAGKAVQKGGQGVLSILKKAVGLPVEPVPEAAAQAVTKASTQNLPSHIPVPQMTPLTEAERAAFLKAHPTAPVEKGNFGAVITRGTRAPSYGVDEKTTFAPHMKSIRLPELEQVPLNNAIQSVGSNTVTSNTLRDTLSSIGSQAMKAAALAATTTTTGLSVNHEADIKPLKNFVDPHASTADAVAAHATTPLTEQIPPKTQAAIISSAKGSAEAGVITKILASNPADFAKMASTVDGRNDLMDLVYKNGGDIKQLQSIFNQMDGLPAYLKNVDPANINEAIQLQIQRANALKQQASMLNPPQTVPGAQGAQTKGVPSPQTIVSAGASLDALKPSQIAPRAAQYIRSQMVKNGNMKSSLSAQLMGIILSALIKSPRYQAALRAGGLQGQLAGLVTQRLSMPE